MDPCPTNNLVVLRIVHMTEGSLHAAPSEQCAANLRLYVSHFYLLYTVSPDTLFMSLPTAGGIPKHSRNGFSGPMSRITESSCVLPPAKLSIIRVNGSCQRCTRRLMKCKHVHSSRRSARQGLSIRHTRRVPHLLTFLSTRYHLSVQAATPRACCAAFEKERDHYRQALTDSTSSTLNYANVCVG